MATGSFTVTDTEAEVKFSAVPDENEEISLELVYDGSKERVHALTLSTAIKLLGRDFVIKKINEVTPSLTEFTSDMDKIAAIRKEIGEAIEKAM